ncbi:hypothetical protein HYW41_05050 [Candidatus Daviesbacteria bacterium]|nr:hypothetical protein [Candidatus Daviesbacteria bacterium]
MKVLLPDILNMGKVLICADGFIRGGNWNNGANTGAFTLNLNNAPSNTNNNIGFRCASDQKKKKVSLYRQNEWQTSKDICPGFKRSQSFLRQRSLAYENIIPVFLHPKLQKGWKVNRINLDKGRDIEPAYKLGGLIS